MSDRTETTYNRVLGINEHNVVVLEYTFVYGDNFTGATGVEIYPVTADMIRDAMKEKAEYLRETCEDADIHGEERRAYMTMKKAEYLEFRYETAKIDGLTAKQIHDELKGAGLVPEDEETPERYTYSSLGRIFPRALKGITYLAGVEEEILPIIREYETNENEWAAMDD